MVPKSQNAKTSGLKHLCSNAVFFHGFLVLTIVYFNNNPFFNTNEIENIILERMLSAKFQTAHLPAAQHSPQFPLRMSHVVT